MDLREIDFDCEGNDDCHWSTGLCVSVMADREEM